MTAVDGREALDLAARLSPDVIVMDLGMPRMDGWTAIRQLRSQARTRNVRILALSAHCSYEEERMAWHSGTDAFRAKPCMPDDLLNEIRRLLTRTPSGTSGGPEGNGPGNGGTSARPPRRRRMAEMTPRSPRLAPAAQRRRRG